MKFLLCFVLMFVLGASSIAQNTFKMARVKYGGGGDWYGDRTALKNLIAFCNKEIGTSFAPEEETVEVGSPALYNYPFLFLTGHGNVVFSDSDAKNLREYLLGGGFLHIDDNYGLDKFIRLEMKKVFPEYDFVELPASHPIFKQHFQFPNGLPKIHKHDGKRPQAFAIIVDGRIVCVYTYECDLGNGWEDFGTYPDDTMERHHEALRMGANIVQFVFNQ